MRRIISTQELTGRDRGERGKPPVDVEKIASKFGHMGGRRFGALKNEILEFRKGITHHKCAVFISVMIIIDRNVCELMIIDKPK